MMNDCDLIPYSELWQEMRMQRHDKNGQQPSPSSCAAEGIAGLSIVACIGLEHTDHHTSDSLSYIVCTLTLTLVRKPHLAARKVAVHGAVRLS